MTSAVEQLDAIWRTWRLQHDALRVVLRTIRLRAVDAKAPGTLAKTLYEEAESAQCERDILACQKTAAEFAVLGMWAVFERRVLQRLEQECHKMLEQPANRFNAAVTAKVSGDVEYWKIDQALDLIKPLVADVGLLGQAKQIKQFRDWVAHRNPSKPTPPQTDPGMARVLLKQLARALDTAPHPNHED